PHHLDVGLQLEKLPQPFSHDRVVVHDHDADRSVQAISSKRPSSTFFRAPSGVKIRPFIATYVPGSSTCTAQNAKPTLKKASLSRSRAGWIAPVSTITLSRSCCSSRAVSSIVSVPCVIRKWRPG